MTFHLSLQCSPPFPASPCSHGSGGHPTAAVGLPGHGVAAVHPNPVGHCPAGTAPIQSPYAWLRVDPAASSLQLGTCRLVSHCVVQRPCHGVLCCTMQRSCCAMPCKGCAIPCPGPGWSPDRCRALCTQLQWGHAVGVPCLARGPTAPR